MRSLMPLPCISSGKVAILTCFRRPLSSHTNKILYRTKIGLQNASGCTDSSRSELGEKALRRKKHEGNSPGWSLELERRNLRSGRVGVRTFACSSQNPEDSRSPLVAAEAEVHKFLDKGYLVKQAEALEEKISKPEICTADELHYVTVPGTNWRLALWHYHPLPNTQKRNHPLLMLSGIGTNAIGFDLDPSVSMARHMAGEGFDTWILEVRGAGLSKSEEELAEEGKDAETSNGALVVNEDVSEVKKDSSSAKSLRKSAGEEDILSDAGQVVESSPKALEEGTSWEAWKTATRLSDTIVKLSDKLRTLLTRGQSRMLSARFIDTISSLVEDSTLTKGIIGLRERLASLLEEQQNSSTGVSQIADLRKKLAQLLEDGQGAVSPRVTDLQERLSSTIDDFQKIVDLVAKYDWDFDNYLEEDVPTAIEFIRNQSKPVDGKILGLGHSMGGIVLYALLSTRGDRSGLAGAVAIASALDYQCSDTSLKLLLPLADPAQVLNVPVVPLGALMTAIHPLVTRPPFALAWLGYQVSARNMMKGELFSKLVLSNFGTIPVKLLLHLATVFQPGGLANRNGTVKYKDNVGKITIPVLAVAGDQDLICPPAAVIDTVNIFPKEIITYKCFGGEDDRHYGHYDLVCSPAAKEEVFPVVLDFLVQNDKVKVGVEA